MALTVIASGEAARRSIEELDCFAALAMTARSAA
jgi:hypothetical protein